VGPLRLDSELDGLVFRIGRPYTPKQTPYKTEMDEGLIPVDFSDSKTIPKICGRQGDDRAQGHACRNGQRAASMR
jgi:hypothetical protein